ncbi:MAG: Maf family protein [Pseudomonadota bacterium]
MVERLILASASAARRAMLEAAGLTIEAVPAAIDEAAIKAGLTAEGAPARDIADKLAELKAAKIARRHPGRLVLGADQILVLDATLFDKPESRAAARTQLQALRGQTHRLLSAAVIIRDGETLMRHVDEARLTMRVFSDAFLERYLDAEGELVLSSVGAYRLEGLGAQLFARVQGDYFTILGLPLFATLDTLRRHGFCMT